MLKVHKGDSLPSGSWQKTKIAIVRSEFNGFLTRQLEDECIKTLLAAGLKKTQIVSYAVPGSLEIPFLAAEIAKRKSPDIIIALGVIIKGDTYHFELVSNQCARGC